jgi:trk system potassium uptake protein TrkH
MVAKRFNFPLIFRFLSKLLLFNGSFMLLVIWASVYYHELEDVFPMLISGVITITLGTILYYAAKHYHDVPEMRKRDGYIIVTLGWVLMTFSGAMPYLFSGAIPNFTSAVFETISGYSTTGASVLTDIESVNKDILLWRSLTQWIGGMGIIVLTVAILPILGIGGMQLFVAEAPGISPDKLQPRIKDTARRLWIIYLILTVAELILLMFGGMDFYEALNHSLTTMATGGFSTYNDSAAGFTPFIQYVMILFMFLAGTNFTLTYFGFHLKFDKIWKNEEFRTYLGLVIIVTVAITTAVFIDNYGDVPFEKLFRDSLFQTVSIITTTGYVSADYTLWPPFAMTIIFVLMFVGASAGSTAGGVKIVRHILLVKNGILSLKRQLHPKAIIPVRLNTHAVSENVVFNVLAFFMIYILIYFVGVIAISMLGVDFQTSLGAVATSLGNIGPGIGSVGPVDNFAHLSSPVKWILSFYMLIGRLELFTVLMLFTPFYWRRIY